ncbi:sigma-70 family RNA polymerase sigma factor [Streptomyces sp. NPDC048278]|uniref:sigma-70 family RNA polymerase sigma factor n=1 Tax=Streptomyces sp. NPDC048278 TaxID=3155809 RepID=UPI00343257F9
MYGTDLVNAARSGDPQAQAALFGQCLPLVYNIVGRGLHGHTDVDDVVQETMLRAMRALPQLREPERFRPWILAIAIRQIQDRGRRSKLTLAHVRPLSEEIDVPDPSGDIADRAIDRHTLSRAGDVLLEASQWLSDDQRQTMALWWQETAGYLTRAEVADTLRLSVPHTAVRIQRMKARLELAVGVLNAWRAQPRCAELKSLADTAGPAAGGRLLTKLSRHVERCARCAAATRARRSIDDAPIRISALTVPVALTAGIPDMVAHHVAVTGPVSSLLTALRHTLAPASAKSAAIGGGAALAAVIGTAVYLGPPSSPRTDPAEQSPAATASAPYLPGRISSPSATEPAAPSPSTASPAYSGLTTADYYVAPGGDDTNPGTLARPFATVTRAVSKAAPGQTVAVRGGTYHPRATITLKASGTAHRRITVSNYRNEHPVLDGSRLPAGTSLVVQSGGHLRVQGLEIVNAPAHPYVCASCHDSVFARLSVHGNGDTGLWLHGTGTHDNLILNSDFFDNHESGTTGGHVNGVVFNDGTGTGNRIQGCRIYDNSGDGVDLSRFADAVTIDRTWAFGNGVDRWDFRTFSGGGSGFKLGGDAGLQVAHAVSNSAAWDNAGFGFTETGSAGTAQLANDTAFRNGAAGFAFVSSAAVLQHNLALANHPDDWLGGRTRQADNSWQQSGWTMAVLRITDSASTTGPRGTDGRLPSTTFLSNTKNSAIGATMQP